jgi:arylsulfatase A-like enzyme
VSLSSGGYVTVIVVAFQCNHEPLEAPDGYIERYPDTWRDDRRWYAAMTTYWDSSLHNITETLKAKGMWDNLLIVVSL